MIKKILLSLSFIVALLGVKAQSGCTIQANCKQIINLSLTGKDSALIYGLVSATDGVKSYSWAQVSGPSTSIISTPGATMSFVKNLVPGVYIYNFSAITGKGTILAPVADTLQILPFIDGIDSIRVFYKSGRITKQ